MVCGFAIVVTFVDDVSQCADMESIACGRGNDLPIAAQLLENSLCSMAFMGLPWPTNNTGIRGDALRLLPRFCNADNVDIPVICAMAIRPPVLINERLCMRFKIYHTKLHVYTCNLQIIVLIRVLSAYILPQFCQCTCFSYI